LHVPSRPQVPGIAVHILDGSSTPACTAVQVPIAPLGGLQVSQTPLQAVSQHTCSTALQVSPAAHIVVVEHMPPFGTSPHEPPTQVAGGVQSLLSVQVLAQARAVPSQRPGAHETVAGLTHVPAPSHFEAGFWVEALGQVAAAHWLLAGHLAHWPALQVPIVPQLDAGCAGQRPSGSAPLVTLLQVPSEPGRLQAWQAAVQAELQQVPDTQCPCWHWVSVEQLAPSGDWPHRFPTHE
jgi:hypothetical protein